MIILLNIAFMITGLIIYKIVIKSYSHQLNHVNIFSFVWLFIIVMSQIIGYSDPYIDEETLTVVYFAWYFFLFGSFIKNDSKSKSLQELKKYNFNIKKIKSLFYIILLLSIIANLFIINEVYVNFTDFERWANYRKTDDLLNHKEDNIFYTMFGSAWSIYIPLAVFLLQKKEIKKYIFNITIIFSILTSIAAFTRAPLLKLMVVFLLSYVLIFEVKKIPIKKILSIAMILFVVFIFSTWILGGAKNLSDTVESVNLYLFGGIAAYQDLLSGKYIDHSFLNYDSKYYSFDFINYILKRFDIIQTYPNYVREFEDHYGTNVYTFLDCFTLDFHILGAMLGSYVIGFISKKSYTYSNMQGNIFGIIVYSTICYYCAMIFMNNEFIRFGTLLFIIEVYILFYLSKVEIKNEYSY